MRRLLPLLLLAALAPLTPASAGCDPETGECYPTDCRPWRPEAVAPDEVVSHVKAGDAAWVVNNVLPPACP